jgi:hypothetical protein
VGKKNFLLLIFFFKFNNKKSLRPDRGNINTYLQLNVVVVPVEGGGTHISQGPLPSVGTTQASSEIMPANKT